jgi:hypothetical protein
MNLFRSEDHVKAWEHYDPASEEASCPSQSGPRSSPGPCSATPARLEPDYLSNQGPYFGTVFAKLNAVGKTGPFWAPPPR